MEQMLYCIRCISFEYDVLPRYLAEDQIEFTRNPKRILWTDLETAVNILCRLKYGGTEYDLLNCEYSLMSM